MNVRAPQFLWCLMFLPCVPSCANRKIEEAAPAVVTIEPTLLSEPDFTPSPLPPKTKKLPIYFDCMAWSSLLDGQQVLIGINLRPNGVYLWRYLADARKYAEMKSLIQLSGHLFFGNISQAPWWYYCPSAPGGVLDIPGASF